MLDAFLQDEALGVNSASHAGAPRVNSASHAGAPRVNSASHAGALETNSFWQISVFDEIDSTNTRIKAAISEGAVEGTCFVARVQTGGYGRQGRAWSSPEGGLYFSFVLDPLAAHPKAQKTLAQLPALSLVVSLAIQEALVRITQCEAIKIKWPNDILVLGKGDATSAATSTSATSATTAAAAISATLAPTKLCGISLEVVQGKICCGVGININSPSSLSAPREEENARAYLAQLAPNLCLETFENILKEVLPHLLESIQKHYQTWLLSGMNQLIQPYNALLFNKGKYIELEAIDGKLLYAGTVLGAAETGELMLKAPSGQTIFASSGESHTRLNP